MNTTKKSILTYFLAFFWGNIVLGLGSIQENRIQFSFLGKEYSIKAKEIPGGFPKSHSSQKSFTEITLALEKNCAGIIPEISAIKKSLDLSDWLYYQLIRKVSQQLFPKEEDYWGYTYCKRFFLASCGFNPLLCTIDNKLLLYIQSNSTIYNVPIKMVSGKQYVCLNFHDHDFDVPLEREVPRIIEKSNNENGVAFDYEISVMPDLPAEKYIDKKIEFKYKNTIQKFDIKVFPEIKDYFKNYPVTDYRFQFNIPLSKATYASIILPLKRKLENKTVAYGVEYILFLVRNAFFYEADSTLYGREKRFSPEEALASERSDCEDYAGLFFSLIREVYNIPMIVLSYPDHVNVGVALKKPKYKTILHNGIEYTICEPTPQKKNLHLGQMAKKTEKQPHEIVYVFEPKNN